MLVLLDACCWIHVEISNADFECCSVILSFIDFIIRRWIQKTFTCFTCFFHRFLARLLISGVCDREKWRPQPLCIAFERIALALFGFSIPYNSCYSHLLAVSPRFWDTAMTCRTTSAVCACEILGWCAVEGGYHGGGSVDSDSNACEQK